MKRIVTIAILISILLCACSSKSSKDSDSSFSLKDLLGNNAGTSIGLGGVPESVIMRNISVSDEATYEIIHDYDLTSHIDDAQVLVNYQGKFGTRTITYAYSYQYDKSADLWSLIGNNNGLQSDKTNLDEQAYLDTRDFTGDFNLYDSGTFDITIEAIDLTNRTIKVNYLLIFDNNQVTSGNDTFEIYENDSGLIYFSIPYHLSWYWESSQWFILNIVNGISATFET